MAWSPIRRNNCGLVAVYYFGALFGCFIGGKIGDRHGRKFTVGLGAGMAILVGTLQAGSQNANVTICARVITELGVGGINAVSLIPVEEMGMWC